MPSNPARSASTAWRRRSVGVELLVGGSVEVAHGSLVPAGRGPESRGIPAVASPWAVSPGPAGRRHARAARSRRPVNSPDRAAFRPGRAEACLPDPGSPPCGRGPSRCSRAPSRSSPVPIRRPIRRRGCSAVPGVAGVSPCGPGSADGGAGPVDGGAPPPPPPPAAAPGDPPFRPAAAGRASSRPTRATFAGTGRPAGGAAPATGSVSRGPRRLERRDRVAPPPAGTARTEPKLRRAGADRCSPEGDHRADREHREQRRRGERDDDAGSGEVRAPGPHVVPARSSTSSSSSIFPRGTESFSAR